MKKKIFRIIQNKTLKKNIFLCFILNISEEFLGQIKKPLKVFTWISYFLKLYQRIPIKEKKIVKLDEDLPKPWFWSENSNFVFYLNNNKKKNEYGRGETKKLNRGKINIIIFLIENKPFFLYLCCFWFWRRK